MSFLSSKVYFKKRGTCGIESGPCVYVSGRAAARQSNLYCGHEVSLNYMLVGFRQQSVSTSITSRRGELS